MTLIVRKIVCKFFGHTEPRLIVAKDGYETWTCLDCHVWWNERTYIRTDEGEL